MRIKLLYYDDNFLITNIWLWKSDNRIHRNERMKKWK